MFAPVAPLQGAVSKVRGQVDTAEDLAHQATRTHEQAERDGDEVPEDLDADQAGHVLDEEYRPLMEPNDDNDDDDDGRAPASRKRRGSKGVDAEGGTFKTRKLEVYLTKGAFFVREPFPLPARSVASRSS